MSLVVDVHAHALLPDGQFLVSQEPGFLEQQATRRSMLAASTQTVDAYLLDARLRHPLVDLDTRLLTMNAAGVDIQAVSVVPWQYHYWADRPLANELVELINSEVAGLVRRAPDRLVGVGTVALQHPDLAAEQLRCAVDDYDFRGVQISTEADGRHLSHPDFDPFWSIAESLGVLVFVHPADRAAGDQLTTAYPADVVVQRTEIASALSHVVFGGVLDRFPGLVICGAHGGGQFPQSLLDADRVYDLRPDSRTTACPPSDYLSRLYFDSLVPHEGDLRRLVDAAGPDRVLLGSDYPFKPGGQPPLLNTLSSDERNGVSGGNARTLLRLNGRKLRRG